MKEHQAKVVDPCYGMTGGALVVCSCGARWVVGNQAWTQREVDLSIGSHIADKENSNA